MSKREELETLLEQLSEEEFAALDETIEHEIEKRAQEQKPPSDDA